MRIISVSLILCSSIFFISCTTNTAPKNRGSIVFGDSSTIVTENDPNFLNNNVQDFVPPKAEPIQKDTEQIVAEAPAKDTVKPVAAEVVKPAQPVNKPSEKGLDVPFKSLDIFIPAITAHTGKTVDWNKAKGASYTLDQGELQGKNLTIKGASINKIQQRTQTVVLLHTPDGKDFKLALPASTGDWQTLKGSNGQYAIAGLGKSQLRYDAKFSPNALKNVVQKLARSKRMNRKDEEKLLRSVRSVRAANQAPLAVAVQSIVWKIAAKDASGKAIERELRIDINH